MVQPLWKTVGSFLKKLNVQLPYGLAVPLLGPSPQNENLYPPKKKIFLFYSEGMYYLFLFGL